MFKKFAKTVAFITAFFSMKELPVTEGKVNLTDDQKQKLQNALGENLNLEEVLEGINKEIADAAAGNAELLAAQEELRTLLDQTNLTEEEKNKITNPDPNAKVSLADQLKAVNTELTNKIQDLNGKIEKLVKNSEGDNPLTIIQQGMKGEKIKHSATHLFGTDKAYDAFEDRPWNAKAAGIKTDAVDFEDSLQVAKLNGDATLYYREHSDQLTNLNRDARGLPSWWPRRIKVVDKISTGTITTAEISQPRKYGWLPKNKQDIQAEEGRIFPVQIDAEFIGFELQVLLESWLNSYNKEGSQAYKVSFVGYLLGFLDRQARLEDRKSAIGGIYVPTPKGATKAPSFMVRQDGILYQLWKGINVTKKLKTFTLGTPTTSNIVDYVDSFIKKLPDEVRELPLVLYLSDDWIRAYKRRYELIHGTYSDYKGYPESPKDYPNIQFEPLVDLAGTDVMFITFKDNIEILENIPEEKSKYKFEMLKRIMYVFADYKFGVRIIHLGTVIKDTDPLAFKVQSVWISDVPLFKPDFFIPAYDDTTGKISAKFNNIKVDDGWVTTITEFTDTYENQIIKLQGNTAIAGATTVADGAKISLAGDAAFNLQSGGTLTLRANADGTVTEIKRTAAPATIPSETINFSGTTIDANAGTVFQYTGGADTLDAITGGVEGKVIKIIGGVATPLTVADVAANINVASNAVLDAANDYVELILVDGIWEEKSRSIA